MPPPHPSDFPWAWELGGPDRQEDQRQQLVWSPEARDASVQRPVGVLCLGLQGVPEPSLAWIGELWTWGLLEFHPLRLLREFRDPLGKRSYVSNCTCILLLIKKEASRLVHSFKRHELSVHPARCGLDTT